MKLSEIQSKWVKELTLSRGGLLTPDELVKESSKKNSPVHDMFEWDDKKAALRDRRRTARLILASVEIVCTERTSVIPIKVPALVENPDKAPGEQGYISTVKLKSKKDSARTALESYLIRAEGHMRKAYEVAAALDLEDEVKAILARIRGMRKAG